ncbi:MAG TPA: hypothetical protein VIR45_06555 [Kiloniellaceae bacterium]
MGCDAAAVLPFGGARILRLFDLAPYEVIHMHCACGQHTDYPLGLPQRLYGLPSDTLICDLQRRLICQRCGRTGDCDVGILDTRKRRVRNHPLPVRLVVCRSSVTTAAANDSNWKSNK